MLRDCVREDWLQHIARYSTGVDFVTSGRGCVRSTSRRRFGKNAAGRSSDLGCAQRFAPYLRSHFTARVSL